MRIALGGAAGETREARIEGGTVLLADFRVPKYPSGNPRQFESDLVVTPDGGDPPFRATVSVNHPLVFRRTWIYQSSYDPQTERTTILAVFRDPWLGLAAAGGILLVLGAFFNCFAWRCGEEVSGARTPRLVRLAAGLAVAAVPLAVIARALMRSEPMPALQSPFLAPHVAAYATSYLLLVLAAFGIGRRFVPLGYFLMTLGLVLGAWWGKVCWGDFWQYDPKELWSFATWCAYSVYFLCRENRFAERALRLLGAVLVVLTATWVNFSSLFAGLHNYADSAASGATDRRIQ